MSTLYHTDYVLSHVLQLAMRREALPKAETLFRYDPPVLILAMTWFESKAQFGRHLHRRLALSYYNDEDAVSVSPSRRKPLS